MNTQKHTPGPWILGNTLAPFGISIWKEHDPERNTGRICQNVSTIANAELICAAPDLYSACKKAYEIICPIEFEGRATSEAQEMLCNLRDAIAKAEGKA